MPEKAQPDFDSINDDNINEGDVLDSLNAAFDESDTESANSENVQEEKDEGDVGNDSEIDIDALFASGEIEGDALEFDGAPAQDDENDAPTMSQADEPVAADDTPAPAPVPDPVLDDIAPADPEPQLADLETTAPVAQKDPGPVAQKDPGPVAQKDPEPAVEKAPERKKKPAPSGGATAKQLDLTLLKAERIGDQLMKLATALGPAVSDIMSIQDSGRSISESQDGVGSEEFDGLRDHVSGALDELASRLVGVMGELGDKLESAATSSAGNDDSGAVNALSEQVGSVQEQLNYLQVAQEKAVDIHNSSAEKFDEVIAQTGQISQALSQLKESAPQDGSAAALEQIVEQVNVLAARVDEVRETVSQKSGSDDIQGLSDQISTLSHDVRSNPAVNAIARVIEGGFKRIDARLEALESRPHPENVSEAIGPHIRSVLTVLQDLVSRPTPVDPAVALQDQFSVISQRLSEIPSVSTFEKMGTSVSAGLNSLDCRIKKLVEQQDGDDGLQQKLDQISAEVSALVGRPQPKLSFEPVEAKFAEVFDGLETLARGLAPKEQVMHLNRGVQELHEKLLSVGSRIDALTESVKANDSASTISSEISALRDQVTVVSKSMPGRDNAIKQGNALERISELCEAILARPSAADPVKLLLPHIDKLVSMVETLSANQANTEQFDKIGAEITGLKGEIAQTDYAKPLEAHFESVRNSIEALAGKQLSQDDFAKIGTDIEELKGLVSSSSEAFDQSSFDKTMAQLRSHIDEQLTKLARQTANTGLALTARMDTLSDSSNSSGANDAISEKLDHVNEMVKGLSERADGLADKAQTEEISETLSESLSAMRSLIEHQDVGQSIKPSFDALEAQIGALRQSLDTMGEAQRAPDSSDIREEISQGLGSIKETVSNVSSAVETGFSQFGDKLAGLEQLSEMKDASSSLTNSIETLLNELGSANKKLLTLTDASENSITSDEIASTLQNALEPMTAKLEEFTQSYTAMDEGEGGSFDHASESSDDASGAKLSEFNPEAGPSQRILTGFRVILRNLSQDADGFREALQKLRDDVAEGLPKAADQAEISDLAPIEEGIEASVEAKKFKSSSGQILVGMETVMRGLNHELDAFSEAVKKISGLGDKLESVEISTSPEEPSSDIENLPAISDIDEIAGPAAMRKDLGRTVENFVVGMGVAMRSLQEEIKALSDFNIGLREGEVSLPFVSSTPAPGTLDLTSVSDLLSRLETRLDEAQPSMEQFYAGQTAQRQLGKGVAQVEFLLRNLQSEVERLTNINRTYENRIESFGSEGASNLPSIDDRLEDQESVSRMSKTAIGIEMLLRSMQSELQRFSDLNSNYSSNLQAADTSTAHLNRGMDDLEKDVAFKSGMARSATGLQIMMQTFQGEIDKLTNLNATLSEKAGGLVEGMGEPTPQFLEALDDMRKIAKQVNDGAPGAGEAKDRQSLRNAIEKINDVGSRFAETIAQEGDLRAMNSENSDLLMALRDDIREQAAEFLAVAAALSRDLELSGEQSSKVA